MRLLWYARHARAARTEICILFAASHGASHQPCPPPHWREQVALRSSRAQHRGTALIFPGYVCLAGHKHALCGGGHGVLGVLHSGIERLT
jgi:hypothetical protein